MNLRKIEFLGERTIEVFANLGRAGLFIFCIFVRKPNFRKLFQDIWYQLYQIGVQSCLIVVVSALFIGMVVGLQGYHTLDKFGVTTQLGQLLALSVTRELGPVLTALLFAGRAGSALTAEIGLMKTTEQLASMDMMGVDPLGLIVYPRFLAGFIALPLLALIFAVVAIYGGYVVGVTWMGVDGGSFWSNMQTAVNFRTDIIGGVIKSLVFAFIVIWVSLYQGISCEPTAEGISVATTKSVVYASVAVLGFDFILTMFMIGDW
ncbi:MAG: ABC transporter permease [Legionellales bacterium RIFCSPHIGHO2_12_FULL_37_14]|nr:MAG: ABC transporter permease [Legionellales bacterium RIFCSPHIGHO2_12_FULL_37_14]